MFGEDKFGEVSRPISTDEAVKDLLLRGKEVQKHPAWLGDLPGGNGLRTGILHCCIAELRARFQDIVTEIFCIYYMATEQTERIKCTLLEKVKHRAHQLAILKHLLKKLETTER